MLLGARQFLERRGAPTPPLPYDAEVEYLEGVDGGYIVLPWAFSTTDRAELDAQFTNISSACYNGNYIPISGIDRIDIAAVEPPNFRINYGPGNAILPADTNRHLFVLDALNNSCRIDGTTYSLPGTHVSTPSNLPYLGLLGRIYVLSNGIQGLNVKGTGCRCFSCKIYRDNILMLDATPVRFTNEFGQSEGAMYDRVLGQLFRNAGTGAFLYGSDKS